MGGTGLFSSVVEHWSRKPGVVSSILTGGIFFRFRLLVHLFLFLFDYLTQKQNYFAAGRIRTCAGKPHLISSQTP